MADTKTTALSAFTPVLTDILYGVDDPGGIPVSGKITLTSVRDLLAANLDVITGSGNIVELRNSTNAQALIINNTYTDELNWEQGFFRWNSNTFEVGTESAGIGTDRSLTLSPGGSPILEIYANSSVGALYSTTTQVRWTTSSGGSTYYMRFDRNDGIRLADGKHISWSNNGAQTNSVDVGLSRSSSGVLRVTDGSTGAGQLIFVVPTSDPGITGALWNDGGSLAISA